MITQQLHNVHKVQTLHTERLKTSVCLNKMHFGRNQDKCDHELKDGPSTYTVGEYLTT